MSTRVSRKHIPRVFLPRMLVCILRSILSYPLMIIYASNITHILSSNIHVGILLIICKRCFHRPRCFHNFQRLATLFGLNWKSIDYGG